jgi:hypothetical protein
VTADRARRRERPVIVLQTASDLEALRAGRLGRPGAPLRIDLPGLAEDEARRVADRLTRLRTACGCTLGTWFGIAALAAAILWQLLSPPEGMTIAMRIGVSFAMVVVGVAAGKMTGLLHARLALRRELDALSAYARNTPRPA